jgi:hypothetical protein
MCRFRILKSQTLCADSEYLNLKLYVPGLRYKRTLLYDGNNDMRYSEISHTVEKNARLLNSIYSLYGKYFQK